ncbi:EamA family transporter RarD [Skermanella rosea]|uniref:EamA family transporter RarD n=1 Tax=Skermanella rosea TaxID=1817965 RepID=UPI001933DD90|nr:EamA family transporter RarD [Skermanella rosea]UEM06043.1 EamA family transporter RarD [Skermanella rosea]
MSESPLANSGGPRVARDARAPVDPAVSGVLYALGAFLVWGVAPIFFKALQPATPVEILSHRVLWSLLLMIVLVLVMRDPRDVVTALSTARRVGIFALTTCLVTTNWLLFIWAVNSDHIVQTSLGYYINPLVNVVLGVLFLGERLNAKQTLSVALAAIGVTSLVVSLGELPWVSLTLATTFGFYALIRKKAGIDPLVGLLIETAMLTPFAAIYLIWIGAAGTGVFTLDDPGLAALLAVSGVVTALPLIFFNFGAQRLKLSTMGLMQYISPTLQLAIGVLLFGEDFTPAHAIAFGLIWLALAIYSTDAFLMHRARR